jgi:hypothetical protein
LLDEDFVAQAHQFVNSGWGDGNAKLVVLDLFGH